MGKPTYSLLFGFVLGFCFANLLVLWGTNSKLPALIEATSAATVPSECISGPPQPSIVSTGQAAERSNDVKPVADYNVTSGLNSSNLLRIIKTCVSSRSDICIQRRIRVFCWVFTTAQNLESRASFVNRTWLQHCDGHAFFVGNSNPNELQTSTAKSLRIVHLESVKESRATLFSKTRKSLEWIIGTEWPLDDQAGGKDRRLVVDSFDWFLKADDDTFAVVENLKLMVADRNPDEAVFFGRHFKKHVKAGYASGGAGYVLSRAAVHRFVEEGLGLAQCSQPKSTDEDVELGRCFEELHVPISDSRDSENRQRFHPVQPLHQFAGSQEAIWQTEYDHHPTSYGEACCANSSVTFHYVIGPQQLLLYHTIYKMVLRARREREHSTWLLADCLRNATSSPSLIKSHDAIVMHWNIEAVLSLLTGDDSFC